MSNLTEITRGEFIAGTINSIKKKYSDLRQASKAPTFALTYQGTWKTLVTNCGFSPAEAKQIVAKYHEMYAVSDRWVADKLKSAADTGYVEGAFGLRVRTPLLAQTIAGNRNTPYEALAEGRTAGNALGQSWCLLNSRAANEFMERVYISDYADDILPCAQIHDAIYLLIRDDLNVLHWVNENLIECMQWQDDPLIEHPTVKIGAELDVFYQNWSQSITLPNHATAEQIRSLCVSGAKKYDQRA